MASRPSHRKRPSEKARPFVAPRVAHARQRQTPLPPAALAAATTVQTPAERTADVARRVVAALVTLGQAEELPVGLLVQGVHEFLALTIAANYPDPGDQAVEVAHMATYLNERLAHLREAPVASPEIPHVPSRSRTARVR